VLVERLARLGYASKAVIYGIVGVLAILAVTNRGGTVTDTGGALLVVLAQPFGRSLLMVLAIGLCGYAMWRLLDAIADPDHDGGSPRGLVIRIGNAVRGGIYGALGVEALRLLRGLRGSNQDEAELWASRVLAFPFGEIAIGIVGVILAMYGTSEVIQSFRGTPDSKMDWSCIPVTVRMTVQKVSQFGVAIRGGLITTLGVYLVRAALSHDRMKRQAAENRCSVSAGCLKGDGSLR
jgi:hypothetical protein